MQKTALNSSSHLRAQPFYKAGLQSPVNLQNQHIISTLGSNSYNPSKWNESQWQVALK